ncbi:PTS fructose transporter subunit IIB [Haloarcula salinisoli]|uniref:Fructose PTS transporter subunit IIB n=1 Tax=Haloarcula salinisoli TaxID=2487746 RepID=A0A8J7YI08_9EURY|nr:PTS fructose transporter subunit IIB [Halomicroarcula salinisoli]MBX0288433.1 fructose PTS transporter subunit IIB [Halomicroarcula salinisoli]MBX0305917.1 fructose PTS transporter subunit IIB [Halomicroarcula salinisoli]
MKFVAVTACPTGIAHSQMGAENLEQEAERRGHDIEVEIQGAMGAENELSAEDIETADAAIIAADTSVNRDRFEDVPLVTGTIKAAVNDVEALMDEAEEAAEGDPDTEREVATDEADDTDHDSGSPDVRRGGDRSKSLVARLKRLLS